MAKTPFEESFKHEKTESKKKEAAESKKEGDKGDKGAGVRPRNAPKGK